MFKDQSLLKPGLINHLLMMDKFRQGWRRAFQVRKHTSPRGANVQGLLIVGEAIIITVNQSSGSVRELKVMKQHIFMKPPERMQPGFSCVRFLEIKRKEAKRKLAAVLLSVST